MSWTERVARVWENVGAHTHTHTHTVLVGILAGKKQLGRPTRRWRILLKSIFKKWDREAWAGFTLDAGLLARSQYSEGPATGHLDTGFPWFPCA